MDVFLELTWRGLIQDSIPGTQDQLNKESTTCYIGFDPTAPSLHVGNLVPVLLLVHLQRAGHKPIALVGGATGLVGDPTEKQAERQLMNEATLQTNLQAIEKQLQRFLDFSPSPNQAMMVNNYDWFKNMPVLDFIRDVGKQITVNYMMAKESVKKRLESQTGMSFTEFTYQLIQGYDFYHLYQTHHCKLQMGGSDQWGNIVTGIELIRRKANGTAFAFTTPLVTKTDGSKFSKSERGNIWLDARLTSPYQFYQFWLNASDEDAKKWIKIFTFLPAQTIDDIILQHNQQPEKRALQTVLAQQVTAFVHSKQAVLLAEKASAVLFSNTQSFSELEPDLLKTVFEGVPNRHVPKTEIENGIDLIDFLAQNEIFSSKGEARKMVQAGGLSVNKEKVGVGHIIYSQHLLHQQYLVIQKGKKQYYFITFQ